ncbi:MAG TPA: hypothetical protein DFR83_21445 [Deltaproteobacteria bacterium]|nr:hypothetical protein [Deltaproteobacteria bacterium]
MARTLFTFCAALLFGCSASGGPKATAGSPADSAAPQPEDTAPPTDTPSAFTCPDDMAPVPADEPLFCIDRWEASMTADGQALLSQEGVIPQTGITFDEARELCANSPVVIDGETVGWRRMASLTEWGDAYDGVVGDGGSTYPMGEEWPVDVCALPTESGEPIYDDLQPTGSLPDCVSAFGVYDQVGNAWEWTDPNASIDVATFLERTAAEGLSLSVDEAGVITSENERLDGLVLEVPGIRGTLGLVEGGVVVALDVVYEARLPFEFTGFIGVASQSDRGRTTILPIVLEQPPEEFAEVDQATITVRWSEDGAPITAKVGCAYYSGGPGGCGTDGWFSGHPHDFKGTIGVRCSADPVPVPSP